ncbi:hypothetical protein DP113_10845 [Brasilonema octagenarum UFV-E1]|uniref:Uncharacterized protein n=2 Tax=Brasilonema TaxID=383614 RepID=A0A856MCC4_9CYAN|nr:MULTISPECIES: hypothetical protein [Brasilonema]NMF63341.1 hypothetical protein [Brasilonema octagenarum UFV-OR1]QDL08338.1 hypothetical protein DP114_10905 [Brasilonema sennae CENA114]QDL14693.1 hypothetical protein DP113_10845 [Brasilonema octagenarum UFV-E1]
MDKSVQDPTPRYKFARLEALYSLVPLPRGFGSLTTNPQLEILKRISVRDSKSIQLLLAAHKPQYELFNLHS